MTSLLDALLAEIEETLAKSTPGPWIWKGNRSLNRFVENESKIADYYGSNAIIDSTAMGGIFGKKEDKDLIAAAPTYLRKLLEVVKVQREALEKINLGYLWDGHWYKESPMAGAIKEHKIIVRQALEDCEKMVEREI